MLFRSGISNEKTYEEFCEKHEEETGLSFEAYVRKYFNMEELIYGRLSEFIQNGKYKTEKNKLFTAKDGEEYDHYELFEAADNTLKFTETSNPYYNEKSSLIKYPIEFTKVN